jgi:threonine dehydrogenase-like Zn-dependent dehydrogenase
MPTMAGLVFPGSSTAEVRELEVPVPGPTEVRIRVRASGLCGSDLMSYRSPRGLRNPGTDELVVVGHEPAGVVEEVGPLVTAFVPGDRVLAYHILGCGNCHQCRLGYPVSCTSPSKVAYGGQRHGGHAELMTAEERSLVALPPQVSYVDGATVACGTSTAYAATRRAGVRAGDRVLVTGLGPVGLAVALFAADAGAEVIGVDPNLERADFAKRYGVHHTVTTTESAAALEQVMELTGGLGTTVAVDCSGSDAARQLALAAASTWGRVVFVGFGGGALTVDAASTFILKQLTLHGSWVSSLAQMEEVVDLLRHRDLHPDAMVTQQYRLDDAPAAYTAFSGGSVGKLVVVA